MGESSMIPMRGIFTLCCARAASGHAAAAPPSNVRNLRRFMSNIDFPVLDYVDIARTAGEPSILLARRQNAPQCYHQPIEFDWFGIKIVAPGSECLFALAGQ